MGDGAVKTVLAGEVLDEHGTVGLYGRKFDETVILRNIVAGSESRRSYGHDRSRHHISRYLIHLCFLFAN